MPKEIKHKILIVDDEEGILNSLKRLLKAIDAQILTAGNGNEALEIVKNEQVSLIISDQRMPGMTGVEFLHRSRDITPDTIRILLTGYADIDTTVDAINSGAIKYYFNKPWDDEFFLSRIKESLDLYENTRENKRLNKLTRRQNEELKEFNRTLEQRVDEQTSTIKEQNKELTSSFMEIIKSFSTIIEIRLKDVGSHSQRVASLAKRIIKGFELNQMEYQDIVMAAFLHDMGKIGLSDMCLKKSKDVLTGPDFEEVAKHPILGQSCLCAIAGFEKIGLIIRHHHEDYDGSGYPDNIKERKIPFGSRVIRIADSFDNHAFKNGYPNSRRLNEASARLVKYSGSKFDPELVKKFIEADIAKQYVFEETSKTIELKPTELQENMIVAEDVYSRTDWFLLPRGAKLSEGMIRRLINIDKVDPIKQGIQVYKPGVTKKKEKEKENATV